jgi:hypothetical protein
MPRFHRRTAPGVEFGEVRRKNNWRRSPSCYSVPQWAPAIDRRRPGPGYRHLLMKRDVERFVELLPHWDDVSRGLDVIVLDAGRWNCDGWYDRGVIGVCAWPVEMGYETSRRWYDHHREMLARLGVRVEDPGPDHEVMLHWTPDTARAYQLCHVFLHELGHHVDRMNTRSKRDNSPRGEDWADQYAWAYELMVLERYFEEFGLPE